MRGSFSVLVLTWVFVWAPGICLGAFGVHESDCHDAHCGPCTSCVPHGDSHNGHDDPCPKEVCRTDSDFDLEWLPLGPVPRSLTTALPTADPAAGTLHRGFDPLDRIDRQTLAHPDETRAHLGLPLLI